MKATGGAKVYKIKKVKTKVGGKNVTMYNLLTRNKSHSTGRNPFGLDMVKGAYLIPVVEGLNEQKTVEIGSAYDNNGEIELVIDKARRPDSWSTVNFDLTQSFYSGGGSSRETALKRQKKIKLKPSQIDKIKKIIKNPEDKHYIENDNFRVSDILDALKRNK